MKINDHSIEEGLDIPKIDDHCFAEGLDINIRRSITIPSERVVDKHN